MTFDPTKFYVGVNIGWLNNSYGNDLGEGFEQLKKPDPPEPSDFGNIIDAYFKHLAIRQINVVRIWVFEEMDGLKLPGLKISDPASPRGRFPRQLKFDYLNQQDFLGRVELVMQKAKDHKLEIYWCLLNAAILGDIDYDFEVFWYKPLLTHLIEEKDNSFFNDILEPFFKTILPFKTHVFAIDIANEIDAAWHRQTLGALDRKAVAAFTEKTYNFVKTFGSFQCTVSFAHIMELGADFNFVDFFDYHRYLDPNIRSDKYNGDLPIWPGTTAPWSKGKACIIGEIGHQYWSATDPINKEFQTRESKDLMNQSLKKNYSGVLLWRYSPVGDDPHRLLKLAPPFASLETFIPIFEGVAASITSSTPRSDAAARFERFEYPVWDEVEAFVGSIPAGRKPIKI